MRSKRIRALHPKHKAADARGQAVRNAARSQPAPPLAPTAGSTIQFIAQAASAASGKVPSAIDTKVAKARVPLGTGNVVVNSICPVTLSLMMFIGTPIATLPAATNSNQIVVPMLARPTTCRTSVPTTAMHSATRRFFLLRRNSTPSRLRM